MLRKGKDSMKNMRTEKSKSAPNKVFFRHFRVLFLMILSVFMSFAAFASVSADTEYGGPGCMVVYNYFDGENGNMFFGCPYQKAPRNQIEFKSQTYLFEPISYGGNKYSFRAVTLPSKWTGGSLKLYPVTPDGYAIAPSTRELKYSVMLRHWANTASGISTYFDLSVPLVKKNRRISLKNCWASSFMYADLSVKSGKLTVTVFHNRFPLTLGKDYSVSFGSKKSNGYKDVIIKGKKYYTDQRVIGQVKASVVLADHNTGTGNTGTKTKTYKVGDTFTKDNCTYKILTLSGKKGTVRLIKVGKIKNVMDFSNSISVNGYTFTLTEIGPNVFKASSVLKSVKLNSSLKKIGEGAFSGCKNLKTVTLDKNLTTIGKKAFYNCTSLKTIVIPAKVSNLGAQAFSGCKKLTKVTFKSTAVSKIGKDVFANASGVKFVFPAKFPAAKASAIKKSV